MNAELLKCLEERVSRWPGVSARSHRFGGREFCLGRLELGHIHEDGALEIPFSRSMRDQLLAEGLAQQHRWLPNSGWTTFLTNGPQDLDHAMLLLRLSYLRYVLKAVPDPNERFEQEAERLGLSAKLKSVLRSFVPLPQRPGMVA
jgi:hypothetical protein